MRADGEERTELLLTTTVGYRITGERGGVCLDVDAHDDEEEEEDDDPSEDGVVLLAIGTWRSTGLA